MIEIVYSVELVKNFNRAENYVDQMPINTRCEHIHLDFEFKLIDQHRHRINISQKSNKKLKNINNNNFLQKNISNGPSSKYRPYPITTCIHGPLLGFSTCLLPPLKSPFRPTATTTKYPLSLSLLIFPLSLSCPFI